MPWVTRKVTPDYRRLKIKVPEKVYNPALKDNYTRGKWLKRIIKMKRPKCYVKQTDHMTYWRKRRNRPIAEGIKALAEKMLKEKD